MTGTQLGTPIEYRIETLISGGSPPWTRFELLRPKGRSAHPGWAPRRDECPAGHTFSGLLGHNEVDAMNQILEFGDTDVDGASLAEVCRRYSVKELSLFGSVRPGVLRVARVIYAA